MNPSRRSFRRPAPHGQRAGSLLAASLALLLLGCSSGERWEDRAQEITQQSRTRLAEMGERLDDLRARLEERVDSTQVRYADELAALDRRRREIEEELQSAARSGEKHWKETSARLEKELAELEKRAEALREHLDDPF